MASASSPCDCSFCMSCTGKKVEPLTTCESGKLLSVDSLLDMIRVEIHLAEAEDEGRTPAVSRLCSALAAAHDLLAKLAMIHGL